MHEGVHWGGISFYEGEGSWGVGGLVRQGLSGEEYEYRRPYGLENFSVSAIISFGGQLLLGTTVHTECMGPEPGFGVRRYDPNTDFLSAVSEICGFAVRKFVVFDDRLWVATELGLAQARRIGGGRLEWQNFVPAPTEQSPMRPIECDALYEELLRSPELGSATAFDMGYAFEEFVERLADLRPEFLARYMRRLPGQPAIDNVAGAPAP